MRLRVANRFRNDFESTSLTDMVFLLLVFFMLTATYSSYDAVSVNLPRSDSGSVVDDVIVVTVTRDLLYYVDGSCVDFDSMGVILSKKVKGGVGHVLIRSDESVPISCVVRLADVVISVGGRLSIATTSVVEGVLK